MGAGGWQGRERSRRTHSASVRRWGVEVGEAVVAVPAVLPALRAKAVAVDDFFGQAVVGENSIGK